MFLFTILANTTNQSLCLDEVYAGGDKKGFDAHIHQAGDSRRSIVGVEGGKHEVAGELSIDGDFRRFEVADFADQNDVRVLTQERSQGGGKIQTDLLFHLDLVDAHEIELNRVFGSHDVCVDGVE